MFNDNARWRALAMLAGCVAATSALADGPVAGPVDAEVVRVIDGDTIAVRAHIWPGLVAQRTIRLAGIDAPELDARCPTESDLALRARDHLAELLAVGRARLMDVKDDKYGGRAMARIVTEDGTDIGQALVRAGLARPMSDGRRKSWCE